MPLRHRLPGGSNTKTLRKGLIHISTLTATATTDLAAAEREYADLLSTVEARIAALPDTASVSDVDRIETEFRSQLDAAEARVNEQRKRKTHVERIAEARRNTALSNATLPNVEVVYESHTYEKGNPYASFLSDLYRARHCNDRQAEERLARGTTETIVDAEKRGTPFRDAEGRALSSSTGAGGDFLPPLYFGDLYAEYKRARRVTASLVRNMTLAAVGNTITVPRITGGTTTAAQQDLQNVSNTDATTAIDTVPVCTVAGYVDLSRQIVERSEPGLDQLMFEDLLADYATRVNTYVVQGTGSGGQPTGILNQAGITTVTYTSASPTVPGLYPKMLNAIRQVQEDVFEPAECFIMTARRWAWILSAVDSENRPLVVPTGQGPHSSLGLLNSNGSGPFGNDSDTIKPAGTLAGIPVYVDETLPKTQGVATNQDVILTGAFSENILWEDPQGPRSFMFEGVTSQTAAIRCQCFGYMAFTAGRFPVANVVLSGTGFTAPTF